MSAARRLRGAARSLLTDRSLRLGKRPVRTVFLRQSKPVILEEWEVREARKF
jgi:hypothetical protein